MNWLSAADAARAVADGATSSEELVGACLARIREAEPEVQAWQFLDEEQALGQARSRDEARRAGEPCGPLHGVPVGIKDIIDTGDMPTEDGTVLHAGRIPVRDAAVVTRLRAAGAVILGKTVTTECAMHGPGKTRNPHNPAHTPGGSSSGSAAAVAAGMVPCALGTQTNGSTIRPASFCGVYGFKPTHGLIPRTGILKLSRTMDTVGVFARTIEDVALVGAELVGFDADDPDTHPRARPPWLETARSEPPLPPRLAFVKTPRWPNAAEDTQAAFAELIEALEEAVAEHELAESLGDAWGWHRTVMEAEMAANLAREWERGRERLSPSLAAQLERGRAETALAYLEALSRREIANAAFDEVFKEYDAILTPSAPGTAPAGLDSTGSPEFNTLWTYCGMPAVSLPLMRGENGLPIGVQLVAKRGDDGRLLRTARWLAARVAGN